MPNGAASEDADSSILDLLILSEGFHKVRSIIMIGGLDRKKIRLRFSVIES
jgi:hypothetical protein